MTTVFIKMLCIDQALAEDPTVFDYDSVYDDLDPLKKERDPKTRREKEGQDRKPKYIAGLMAAAEKRMKVRGHGGIVIISWNFGELFFSSLLATSLLFLISFVATLFSSLQWFCSPR